MSPRLFEQLTSRRISRGARISAAHNNKSDLPANALITRSTVWQLRNSWSSQTRIDGFIGCFARNYGRLATTAIAQSDYFSGRLGSDSIATMVLP
jgi:hypothetical protein